MRLKTSRLVASDLAEIDDFIARDSPQSALRLVRLLKRNLRGIANKPLLYRLRPELGTDIRLAPVGKYVILFRIQEKVVRIERIVHGGRELLALLDELDFLPPR
jgi:plasmid stabilization system protein ParE